MSRTVEAAHREVLSLLPEGFVWPGPDSVLGAILKPFAEEIVAVEAAAEAMLEQIDPRTATDCLEDFERVLGADPCGRDVTAMSEPDRQALAHQRWTARGGQSIAYFEALAAKRGVQITIEEVHPSEADRLRAGDELVNSPEQFIWRVVMVGLSDVECDIRRAKPAYTEVVFTYLPPTPPPEPRPLTFNGDPLRLLGSPLTLPA